MANGVGATLANALVTLAPQVLALLTLSAQEFGRFSLVYLVYAFGTSVTLSTICEAFTRGTLNILTRTSDREYLGVAVWCALTFAGLAGLMSLIVVRDAISAGGAVLAAGFAVYRVAARYREVQLAMWTRALLADVVGLSAFVVVFLVLRIQGVGGLREVFIAWAASAFAATIIGLRSAPTGPDVIRAWFARYRHQIMPLLRESLILDASSIGAPYVIAPVLGAANFGIYRAVSNVAAPVRLVLNPLRPLIAGPLGRRHSRKSSVLLFAASFAFGGGAYISLLAIDHYQPPLGVLLDLAPYATATGVFVALNVLSHFYYLVGRTHASPRRLWRGRLVQSGTAFAVPIVGAWTGGLTGAIWAYVASTLVGMLTWLVIVRSRRPEDPHVPTGSETRLS